MKVLKDVKHGGLRFYFEDAFTVLDAIRLPEVLELVPHDVPVTLDFRHVPQLDEAAVTVLLPALASCHHPRVFIVGFDGAAELERVQSFALA